MTFVPGHAFESDPQPDVQAQTTLIASKWDDHDLRRRARIVLRAFPGLKKNPDILGAIIRQDMPDDDIAVSVRRIAGQQIIAGRARQLKKMSGDEQRVAWDAMDKTSQHLVRSAGYAGPPEAPPADDGYQRHDFWDWVNPLSAANQQMIRNNPAVTPAGQETGVVQEAITGKKYDPFLGSGSSLHDAVQKAVIQPIENAVSDVGDTLDEHGLGIIPAAIRAGGEAVQEGASFVLDAQNTISSAPKHLYRFVSNQQDFFGNVPKHPWDNPFQSIAQLNLNVGTALVKSEQVVSKGIYGKITGDDKAYDKLSTAWEDTGNGERYFNQQSVNYALDALGDDPHALDVAKQMAGGSTIADIAAIHATPGTTQYQQKYMELLGMTAQSGFGRAMKTLALGKVSPGRDFARAYGVPLDSPQGAIISGAADAAFTWYTDPLIIAGKIRHAWKAADAIRDVADINALQASEAAKGGRSAYNAMADEIAGAISSSYDDRTVLWDYFKMKRARLLPSLSGLLAYDTKLRDAKLAELEAEAAKSGVAVTAEQRAAVRGIETGDDVWDWYKSQDGMDHLARGRWSQGEYKHFFLPKLTRTEQILGGAFHKFDQAIDFMAQRDVTKKLADVAPDGKPWLPDAETALKGESGWLRYGGQLEEWRNGELISFRPDPSHIPDVPEGYTRIYRVQGPGGLTATPNSVQPTEAHMWWTDNIENARLHGLGIGDMGHFHYADVPNSLLDSDLVNNVSSHFDDIAGVRSFSISPEAQLNAKQLGAVGDFAEVNGKVTAYPVRSLIAAPFRLTKMLMTRVPQEGVLRLYGSELPVQLSRLLDMEYGGTAKAEMFDTIMKADNPAVRRELVKSAMDRIFWSMGVYETDEGIEFARKYIQGVEQKYMPGNIDMVTKGTQMTPEGIYPFGDHADAIAIPDYREMMAQARRAGVINRTLGGINNSLVDGFMGSYWKPAMLLRLGFAPRAAAEEALATLLRSPEVFTQGALLRIAKATGEDVVTYKGLARASRNLSAFLDPNIETAFNTGAEAMRAGINYQGWLDRLGNIIGNQARGWVRGMALSQMDPQVYRGSRILAESLEIQGPLFDREVNLASNLNRWGASLLDEMYDSGRGSWFDMPGEDGKVKSVRLSRSQFKVYNFKDNPRDTLAFFAHQTDRAMHEPSFRALVEARQLYMHPEQARRLGADAESGYEQATKIREILHARPEAKRALTTWLSKKTGDEAAAAKAFAQLEKAADGNETLTYLVGRLRGGLDDHIAWALLTDKRDVLNTLTRLDAHGLSRLDLEAMKGYGPVEEAHIHDWARGASQEHINRWDDLAERAMHGEDAAARQLAAEAAARQLQHPLTVRMWREMYRSQADSAGNLVAKPLEDGKVAIYFPTFNPQDSDAIFSSLNPDDPITKAFIKGRHELPRSSVDAIARAGYGPLFAGSTWASADPQEVRNLIEAMERSAPAGKTPIVGMSRVDIPEEEFRKWQYANEGAGTHEFGIDAGHRVAGIPIDLNGKLLGGEGNIPLQNAISLEDAVYDHANVYNKVFDQLFVDSKRRPLHELTVRGARKGKVLPEWIYNRDYGVPIPEQVVGPTYELPDDPNAWQRIVSLGFDRGISGFVNAVSRNPLFMNNAIHRVALAESAIRPFMQNKKALKVAQGIAGKVGLADTDQLYNIVKEADSVAKSNRIDIIGAIQNLADESPEHVRKAIEGLFSLSESEWSMLRGFVNNESHIRQAIGSAAAEGAMRDSASYFDDHRIRSQFADQFRSLSPFWWAQEAFVRRWARTLQHSPEAIRKGQLMVQGLRSAGFVHQDADGNDYFIVPGSQQLGELFAKGYGAVFHKDMPKNMVPMAFSNELKMTTPGFADLGVPSFGPLVAIPMGVLRSHFPEFAKMESDLLGERAAGRSPWDQLVPSWMSSIVRESLADKEKDPAIASATIQAMMYLEATGHGLPENATVRQRQDFIDRTANWAKSMVIFRTIFAFADMAPPKLEIADKYSEKFQEYFQNLPLEEAIGKFIEKYPDATAYTIFKTKPVSGAPIPATQAATDFMEKHRDYIHDHPLASSWLLPQSDSRDENVRSTYALQQELGLREQKTPSEWYQDFKFGQAADVYFKSKDHYELERSKLLSASARAKMDDAWSSWKESYFKAHPVFADEIQTRSGVQRRTQTLDDLRTVLADPNRPKGVAHEEQLRVMLQSYDHFQSEIDRLKGERGAKATRQRDGLRSAFYSWAKDYTTEHPEVLAFYQRIIDPMIGLDAVDRQKLGG